MSNGDWQSLLEQKLRLAQEMSAAFQKGQEEEWRTLAGPLYEKMLESRRVTEELLGHEDRDVRLVAVGVLSFVWHPGSHDRCAGLFERMALNDVDLVVRATALCALATCNSDTFNPRVGRLMTEILLNESQPTPLRRCAYLALFTLRGRIMPPWPGSQAKPPTMLRIPEDIDWTFVKSFLQERE